jgi:hypothetical protein
MADRMERVEQQRQERAARKEGHTITTRASSHEGSVPYVFDATCSCGWRNGRNAWKWVAYAIEDHLTAAGLMNGRGRLRPLEESGDA